MQRSKSASNRISLPLPDAVQRTAARRKSAGCLKRMSSYGQMSSVTDSSTMSGKHAWRSPGHCQIPDVLGNAYLKPELPMSYDLRPVDVSKRVSNRPWYPPSPYYEIPQPPPLTQRADNEFERKLRKVLKNVRVRTADPRLRYSHFQEIGTGVNGAVVRARYQRKPNVQVAIKRCILYPDRDYRQAIVRELCIMASRHPNLIRLREVSIWRDDLWIAMDLMRCSVFTVLCRRGIPEEHTVHITCETLKALMYLHAIGYLHRDIKCENILLGQDGQVKLADFGLSACIDRHNRDRLGTNKWMAPELIRQEVYDEKIDMWSLGITIIEMMDRVPPHYLIKNEDELFHIVTTEPGPTFKYSYPSIYMRGLVAWLLDEEPRSRPSANDVLMELDVHIKSNLLPCSSPSELARFLGQVLPPQ
ncbi:kinase-like domain-containing protein [Fennellomyces sp. T-0311]|nr:kinase-like domain-containing protein [Fennellomyces sp. T-0311]